MDAIDGILLDSYNTEVDTLREIARRLKIWSSEVERPESYILDSLGDTLQRCATRLFLVGTDLQISKILAEEKAQRRKTLLLVETLPVWTGPWYLQSLAWLAEQADFRRKIERHHFLLDPNG